MKRYSFKKLGAVLALASLAIRIAVAFLHVPMALAADIASASSSSGNFLLVYCTVHGTLKVPAETFDTAAATGDDGQDPTAPTDHHGPVDPPLCPICHAVGIAATGIDSSASVVLAARHVSREKLYGTRTDVAPRLNAIRLSARGPPLAAFA